MMAPAGCILLERRVIFAAEPPARIGSTSGGIGGSAGGANKEQEEEEAIGGPIAPCLMPMKDILEAMKPDSAVFDPPEISRLYMERQMMGGPPLGIISSTDKSLVVLYAGFYQPGFSTTPSSGCYLLYDAASNSLSAIPQLPDTGTFRALGSGAAILSRGEGKYELAELVAGKYGFPDAALFLWQCPNLTGDKWIRKAVRLPHVFDDEYSFKIDMSFSYAGSSICWVDLLKGVLICNMVESTEPKFTFIPLPEGCSIDIPEDDPRPRPQTFHTMGCSNGVIKFVTVAGHYEGCNIDDVMLKTWTLTADLKKWEAGTYLALRDLWASTSFRARSLPKIVPSYPVISINEEEVVYVVLNEVDRVRSSDIYGSAITEFVPKAHHVLRLDMMQKKVLNSSEIIPNNMTPGLPNLIASEFSVYLQG